MTCWRLERGGCGPDKTDLLRGELPLYLRIARPDDPEGPATLSNSGSFRPSVGWCYLRAADSAFAWRRTDAQTGMRELLKLNGPPDGRWEPRHGQYRTPLWASCHNRSGKSEPGKAALHSLRI